MESKAPEKEQQVPYVVRKEFRSLSKEEQEHYIKLCRHLSRNTKGMDGKDIAGSSELFKIAAYHSYPHVGRDEYCPHKLESFPVWHRIYMVKMERALQEADRELGGTGNVALPYWDWTRVINDEVIPKTIREQWPKVPENFLPEDAPKDENYEAIVKASKSGIYRESDERFFQKVGDIDRMVQDALHIADYSKFATKLYSPFSLETPHDLVHDSVGGLMASIPTASYDIIFYLHHCNIDRIYEAYLRVNPDSADEYEANQQMEEDKSRKKWKEGEDNYINRFTSWLTPFRDGHSNRRTYPIDGFNQMSTFYNFEYDELPKARVVDLKATTGPTYALFQDIKTLELKRKSYIIYVFVLHKDETWREPKSLEEVFGSKYFAGRTAIFGGRAEDCATCRVRPPYDDCVDISGALAKQGLSRRDAIVKVITEDQHGHLAGGEESPGLSTPSIVGSVFEDPEGTLSRSDSWNADVEELQTRLKALNNLYPGAVDGIYGSKTEEAVRKFQHMFSLNEDGIADATTKNTLLEAQFHEMGGLTGDGKPTFAKGATLRYFVGVAPGYLKRLALRHEVRQCFDQWEDAGADLTFKLADNEEQADIVIKWEDKSKRNRWLFGHPGGALAQTDDQSINLDNAERWILTGKKAKPGQFYLTPVLLREIGSVLGLLNSGDRHSVMFGYYNAKNTTLSENDRLQLTKLYGSAQKGSKFPKK